MFSGGCALCTRICHTLHLPERILRFRAGFLGQRTGRASECDKGERVRNWRIISTIARGSRRDRRRPGLEVRDQRRHPGREGQAPRPALVAKSRIARGTVFDQVWPTSSSIRSKIPCDSLPPNRILPGVRPGPSSTLYKGKVAATDIFAGTRACPNSSCRRRNRQHRRRCDPEGQAGHHGEPRPDPRGRRLPHARRQGQPHPESADDVTIRLLGPPRRPRRGPSHDRLPASRDQGHRRRVDDGPPGLRRRPGGTATAGGARPPRSPESQPASLITLEVTPRQAEQIVQATTIVGTRCISAPNPAWFRRSPALRIGGSYRWRYTRTRKRSSRAAQN